MVLDYANDGSSSSRRCSDLVSHVGKLQVCRRTFLCHNHLLLQVLIGVSLQSLASDSQCTYRYMLEGNPVVYCRRAMLTVSHYCGRSQYVARCNVLFAMQVPCLPIHVLML